MKFAKVVFTGSGLWGLLVLTPLYFLIDEIGKRYPPAVTHPDFYYGFLGVALSWQFAFLVIGRDPERFRPLIFAAICEKAFYVVSLCALYARGRIEAGQIAVGAPDVVLGTLFIAALFKTSKTV